MQFGHPDQVFWFFLLPLFLGLWFYFNYRQARARKVLADSTLLKSILPLSSPGRVALKWTLKILAFIFLVLALMEPKWGMREEQVTMRGVHLMVLVDVSNSMLAQDIPPSRLERVRRKLKDLVDMLAGDRVGLVVFAGRSFLLSPLTNDYGTLAMFSDEISTETIPVQGTDLVGALQLALKAMPEDDTPKAVLVMSDGEDHSERLEKVLKDLKEKDVKVFVMGIGTPQGAPVPQAGGGFKSNSDGNMIVSKLNEDFLQKLATQTGGVYVRTVTNDADLQELYLKGIRGVLSPNELKTTRKKVWESRFYWPLALALVFLVVERIIPEAKGEKKRSKQSAQAATL